MTQHPIAAFLHARWEELEQKARAAEDGPWTIQVERVTEGIQIDAPAGVVVFLGADSDGGVASLEDAAHIVAHDPAHVLADIAAKRQILNRYQHALGEAAKLRDRYREAGRLPAHGASLLGEAHQWDHTARRYEEPLKILALPFTQHPDYQEDWAP